jgi:DEAD/DEAH box helicase domain-containing protein
MILYPTNALVEDQVSRLRGAIQAARGPRDAPQLFFGRYTGATWGGQGLPARLDEDRVQGGGCRPAQDRAGAAGARRLRRRANRTISDPRCGEMMTRWGHDRARARHSRHHFSMLNVMMMRDVEEPIFAATRDWLAGDPSRCFTLVVDELHSYRGTQGSEVALVVRSLLRRLGIDAASPQLRCIATSASLDGEAGQEYVEQFFGIDRATFDIIPGAPRPIEPARQLPREPFAAAAPTRRSRASIVSPRRLRPCCSAMATRGPSR